MGARSSTKSEGDLGRMRYDGYRVSPHILEGEGSVVRQTMLKANIANGLQTTCSVGQWLALCRS